MTRNRLLALSVLALSAVALWLIFFPRQARPVLVPTRPAVVPTRDAVLPRLEVPAMHKAERITL